MKTTFLFLLVAITSAVAQTNTNFFATLSDDNGKTLLTNAEFRSIVGRKMIFKQTDTGQLKAIDVAAISASAREQLNIDVNAAMEKQKEIDDAKAKALQYHAAQAAEITKKQEIETKKAVERNEQKKKQDAIDAKKAESERKAQRLYDLEIQRKQADIENTRASTRALNRTP